MSQAEFFVSEIRQLHLLLSSCPLALSHPAPLFPSPPLSSLYLHSFSQIALIHGKHPSFLLDYKYGHTLEQPLLPEGGCHLQNFVFFPKKQSIVFFKSRHKILVYFIPNDNKKDIIRLKTFVLCLN